METLERVDPATARRLREMVDSAGGGRRAGTKGKGPVPVADALSDEPAERELRIMSGAQRGHPRP